MLHSIKELRGYAINAKDGQFGHVDDVLFDDQNWVVRYIVVRTGGFLLRNDVLISPLAVLGINLQNREITVSLSRDQIANSPDIDTDKPVSRQMEIDYYNYYNWPYYWSGSGIWGNARFPGRIGLVQPADLRGPQERINEPFERVSEEELGNPHLRSCESMRGYRIEATDGAFGHVEDFVMNEENWRISYLDIDTKSWWPSKSVLILPEFIRAISWDSSLVSVDLPKSVIKAAPQYDQRYPITSEYQSHLEKYYGKSA